MNPSKNEILGQSSESNEIKIDKQKQQNEKPILPDTTKGDLEHIKSEKSAEKLLNDLDKQDSKTKEKLKTQVQKEAKEKGFSWDRVWEETKKAFKEKGLFAAIGVFFSELFSNIFNKAKEGAEDLVETATNFANGETPGKWNGDIYTSEKGKLQLERTKEGLLKNNEVKINGINFLIESSYSKSASIKEIDGSSYLVLGENKISLDRLGKVIDESEKNKNEYLISDNTDLLKTIKDKIPFTDGFELKLVREDYYGKIEKNKLKTGNTLIEFKNNIERQNFPIKNLKINKIIINGKKFIIEPKNEGFNLLKEGNKYLLSVDGFTDLTDLDDFTIDIRKIAKQIDPKNMKPKSNNEYYLFNSKVDIDVKNDVDLIRKGEEFLREKSRPDVFLLKEIK